MAEEGAGLEGLRDADSAEDEGVVEPRGQIRRRPRRRPRRGCLLQQPPRRLQRRALGAGGHPSRRRRCSFRWRMSRLPALENSLLWSGEEEAGRQTKAPPWSLRFQRRLTYSGDDAFPQPRWRRPRCRPPSSARPSRRRTPPTPSRAAPCSSTLTRTRRCPSASSPPTSAPSPGTAPSTSTASRTLYVASHASSSSSHPSIHPSMVAPDASLLLCVGFIHPRLKSKAR